MDEIFSWKREFTVLEASMQKKTLDAEFFDVQKELIWMHKFPFPPTFPYVVKSSKEKENFCSSLSKIQCETNHVLCAFKWKFNDRLISFITQIPILS